MSKSANVRSVQALKDFRIAFCNFAEDARGAVGGVEMEIRKFRDWLERDQLNYWRMQVKKREEMLMEARAALHKKKLAAGKSDAVSDSEEKENLRNATRLLRVAEEKVEVVKKLIPQFHHAVDEYHSHSQPLSDHLSGGFERSLAKLSTMIESLESYLALQAPVTSSSQAASFTPSSGTSRTTAGASAGSTSTKRDDEPPTESEPKSEADAVAVGASEPAMTSEVQP